MVRGLGLLEGLGGLLIGWGLVLAGMSFGLWPALALQIGVPAMHGHAVPTLVCCAGWLLARRGKLQGPLAMRTASRVACALLILLPIGVLLGYGLAQPRHSMEDVRMAPGSALAFLATGVALAVAQGRQAWQRRLFVACSGAASLIVLAAVAGHLLNLESLYALAGVNNMRLPTALALAAVCVGLWWLGDAQALQQADARAHQDRITRRALVLLSLVAVVAGVGGFALLRGTLEQALADSMLVTARSNAAAMAGSIEQRLWFPRVLATRPALADLLAHPPSQAAAHQALSDELAASLLTAEIQGLRLLDAGRVLRGQLGRFDGDQSPVTSALARGDAQAELRWQAGYLLRTETALRRQGRTLGYLVAEQRLPAVDRLLRELRASNATADALICSRQGDIARCAPTRLYAQAFDVPMLNAQGQINYPINRALLGQSDVEIATDLRGVRVVAAYTPIQQLGLGLVLKSDMATVYAPLRGRLAVLAVLLMGTVAVGAWALSAGVRPLLQRFLREQERNRLMLEHSHEAFFAVAPGGEVLDWNRSAEALFGIPAPVARGQALGTLLRAQTADGRSEPLDAGSLLAHQGGLSEARVSGPDGVTRVLELSVSQLRTEAGDQVFVFARDLSQRRLAEQQLRDSEHSLRTIAATVPALISRIARSGEILFANEHCASVYGLGVEQLLGRTLRDIRGPEAAEQLQPHIDRVLAGEAVRFESHSLVQGVRRFFQQAYVPDVAPDGSVQGFYAVSFDITELKGNEQRLAESERWLRDITDNLPVLIAYIDPERHIRFINETGRDWLGLAPGQPAHKPVHELMSPGNYADTATHLARALDGHRTHFEEVLRVKGNERCLATDFVPDAGTDGVVQGIYALSADVTALKATERQLTELLDSDTLTGLANRRCLGHKLPEALARSRRLGVGLALMYLDVDRFKSINDTHGHAVGDAVLVEFARRLQRGVRETDTVVRLAGDEFVVLLEGLREPAQAEWLADKIVAAVTHPMLLEALQLDISASIGVAYLPFAAAGLSGDDLIGHADAALYQAKRAGRGGWRLVALGEAVAEGQAGR
jgi:diguanylate cyclase (GGDEF)-like protein/PAS domain S-box-containing protein